MVSPMVEAEPQAGARILIVDDDAMVCRVIRRILQHEGFQVDVAPSAATGLSLIEQSPPDLIILDMAMPGISGAGFLRQISDGGERPRFHVLVCTGWPGMADMLSDVAVDGLILKPCTPGELLGAVRRVCGPAARA
jgi:DNA-binding response OmpR family regulator